VLDRLHRSTVEKVANAVRFVVDQLRETRLVDRDFARAESCPDLVRVDIDAIDLRFRAEAKPAAGPEPTYTGTDPRRSVGAQLS